MRLDILPDILFDEFPTTEYDRQNVNLCFFTQPKEPPKDCLQYVGKLKIFCSSDALRVMSCFKRLPRELFGMLAERQTKFNMPRAKFFMRCIETGSVNKSVMLLITIDEKMYLYTGQFGYCRKFIFDRLTFHYLPRIKDIYIDNRNSNIKTGHLLIKARDTIVDLIREKPHHLVLLHSDMFGIEELLFELAAKNIRIQLNPPQKELAKLCGHEAKFEFSGNPQIKIKTPLDRTRYSEDPNVINVRLTLNNVPDKIYGTKNFVEIPYTTHPGIEAVQFLLRSLKPERVHPLLLAEYGTDSVSMLENAIPIDCEICIPNEPEDNDIPVNSEDSEVEGEDEDEEKDDFLDLTDQESLGVTHFSNSEGNFYDDTV